MVLTDDQAATRITAVGTQATSSSEDEASYELLCQYPSKKCERLRATKRGGDLHRLCAFHRERANKNQWLVDQRRRLRRERQPSTPSPPRAKPVVALEKSPLEPEILMALDTALETNSPMQSPLNDDDLYYLESLLFDEEDDILLISDSAGDADADDGYMTDATAEWTP